MVNLNCLKKYEFAFSEIIREYGILALFQFAKLGFLSLERSLKWLDLKSEALNGLLKVEVCNNTMFLNVRGIGIDLSEESLSKQLALDGIREPESTKFLRSQIGRGDILLDIGANIGYYVLIEASLVGENGKIYAIEPSPDNIKLLKKNVEENNYSDLVEVYPMAVASKKGRLELFVSSKSNLNTTFKESKLIVEGRISYDKTIEVEGITVDEFLRDKEAPTFIRMDIEGGEVEVIEGMEETLQSEEFRKLFVEIHPHLIEDTRLLVSFLKKLKHHRFQTTRVISHDDFLRGAIGITKIEDLTIDELIEDYRVRKSKCAFEVFFERR